MNFKTIYRETMEPVKMDETMQRQIRQAVSAAAGARRPAGRDVVLRWAVAAAVVLAVIVVPRLESWRMGSSGPSRPEELQQPGSTQYDDLTALVKATGIALRQPQLPFAVEAAEYFSYPDGSVEIRWYGAEQQAVLRVAGGQQPLTVNDGSRELTAVTVDQQISVYLTPEADGYREAAWVDQGRAYTLSLSQSLDEAQWQALVASIYS
jgi:hypothetical protein